MGFANSLVALSTRFVVFENNLICYYLYLLDGLQPPGLVILTFCIYVGVSLTSHHQNVYLVIF